MLFASNTFLVTLWKFKRKIKPSEVEKIFYLRCFTVDVYSIKIFQEKSSQITEYFKPNINKLIQIASVFWKPWVKYCNFKGKIRQVKFAVFLRMKEKFITKRFNQFFVFSFWNFWWKWLDFKQDSFCGFESDLFSKNKFNLKCLLETLSQILQFQREN